MVVCTNIKDGMVFAVVPANHFIVLFREREEIVGTHTQLLALLHLRQKPRTADDRMCFQELQG